MMEFALERLNYHFPFPTHIVKSMLHQLHRLEHEVGHMKECLGMQKLLLFWCRCVVNCLLYIVGSVFLEC